jgi:hypothetical protein
VQASWWPLQNKKADWKPARFQKSLNAEPTLLDLAFLELDMLAHDGIIFLHDHFLRHVAGVFLGHVKIAGVCRRIEADLDGGGFRHRSNTFVASPDNQDTAGKFRKSRKLQMARQKSILMHG